MRALTGASRYLEVGVYGGATFLNVQLPTKDAVDPAFQFDTAPFATESVRFFPMASNEFFTSAHPRPQYDIIFLDGLHTFEQTFRDFLVTLPLSHEQTVWLIDDTLPSDPYSALPDQSHSYTERQKAGAPGNPWHGDVYKVVCAIHDFCPNLNFATVVDHGNPQTLVWREPRAGFSPVFGNLEAITRLSYFDIDAHAQAMRFCTEEHALAQLSSALTRRAAAPNSRVF
jgi:hypothetical protein